MARVERSWFAVRCVFQSNWPPLPDCVAARTYEERITLWRAGSSEEAIEWAEAEARRYAAEITERPSEYLGLAQCFALDDQPSNGAEVFSLMRDSDLDHDPYLDAFFATGAERARDWSESSDRGDRSGNA